MLGDKTCTDRSPPWFVGHWRDWHRGHGCDQDDGKPRSEKAQTEIAQHEASEASGILTDAELRYLCAATTSGDTLLVRALVELTARRAGTAPERELRRELDETAQALVEALDLFDRSWCPEHGHAPRPEVFERVAELRKKLVLDVTEDIDATAVECPTCGAWVGWACKGADYGYHAAGYHPSRERAAEIEAAAKKASTKARSAP
jgi:hypothetical protein